jgi:hypothetical protein
MPKKTFTLLGTILILCFSAMPSTAGSLLPEGLVIEDTYQRGLGQPVGKFLLVQGDVVVIHGAESVGYRAYKGLPVYKMDTLISLERSRSLVEMNDRSRLTLASHTRITVNRSVYRKARRERSSFFSMALGKARFWVTKMVESRRSEFRVKTPTAVVGVRGSDFVVAASLETTEVITLADTELEVISAIAPEEPVILTDFQQTTVDIDTLPTEVTDISLDLADDLMNDMPVETNDAPLTGQTQGGVSSGDTGTGKDKGGTGTEKKDASPGKDEGGTGGEKKDASSGKDDGSTGTEKKDASSSGEKASPATASGGTSAGESTDQTSQEGGTDQDESGDDAAGETDSEAKGGEPPAEDAGTEPAAGEGPEAAGEPEPVESGAEPFTGGESAEPLTVDAEPEIFVDDGELIEPEFIEEEVEVPAPLEPLVGDLVEQEQVETVQEVQQNITQEIYEETVAGELPDFPALPE